MLIIPGIIASSYPVSTTSFDSIATQTVGAGGAASVEFTNIPSTYKHLQIRGIGRSTYNLNASTALLVQLNGNATVGNYATHLLDGSGAAASAYGASGDWIQTSISNATASANIFGAFIIDILDYTDTNKYKTVRMLGGNDNNGSGNIRFSSGALYSNTNAVTSIKLLSGASSNLTQYSHFALYGVKG